MSNDNNYNSSDARLIHLAISDKQKGIIVRSVFAIDTRDIITSLNHKYESTKVIFTIDKKWQKNHKIMRETARAIGVKDEDDLSLLISHLDDNWEPIITKIKELDDAAAEESKIPKLSTVDVILDLFQRDESSKIFKDEFKKPHALVKINGYYQVLEIDSTNFRRHLQKIYYDDTGKVPNSEAIKNAVNQLEATAYWNGETINLHLRTAWNSTDETKKDTIYYDLSDDKNRCVKITTDGCTILENQTNVLFRRYNNQRPQIEPLPLISTRIDDMDDLDDVFDEFMGILNIKNPADKLLLKCYIISLFIPDFPHVILMLLGEQGGAKTMLQELIRQLADPSNTGTFSLPSNQTELIQQLNHNYIVYYDNVSYIADWISDLFCRSVTGNSASKRALFTNDEDFYYRFKRNIGINGIDIAKIKPDLSDRAITIKQERIDRFDRKKEAKIWAKFNEFKPRLLSYIFNILSKVLAYKKINPEITFPNGLNRMADWEEYAEIISRCMGNPSGELQTVYKENLSRQIEDAIASNQLCLAVIEYVKSHKDDKNNQWQEKTPTDLYEILTTIARSTLKLTNLNNRKYWPQSPGSLSYNLNLVKTVLREKGIEVITGIKNNEGNRVIKIINLEPVNAPKTSSTSSTSSNTHKPITNQGENLDDVNDTGDKTSSKETRQNQAQNANSGRFDGLDGLFPTNTGNDEKKIDDNSSDKDTNTAVIIQTSTSNKKNSSIEFTKKRFESTWGKIEDYQIGSQEDIILEECDYAGQFTSRDDDYDEYDYYSNNNEEEGEDENI